MGAMAAEEVSIKWNIVLSNVRGNGSLRGRPLQLMGVWHVYRHAILSVDLPSVSLVADVHPVYYFIIKCPIIQV